MSDNKTTDKEVDKVIDKAATEELDGKVAGEVKDAVTESEEKAADKPEEKAEDKSKGAAFKKFIAKCKPYALPGLITFAIFTLILIFKGIWPFGSNRIDYFDNMQQVAPLYSHLWDWMHGKASLWFDWYTGLGTNVSMSVSAFSMLSPFNLFFYLIPRDYILESISILTGIKMMTMAITMFAFINYSFKKIPYSLKVTFAVMYSFCGYVLLYGSCFTPWMDIVALFPLLMMAVRHMFLTGKKLFYIVMLGLVFIINYYLSAMSLVYIFLAGGIYILLSSERKKWKEHAWNLGISTIAGVGLSAFVLVPVFIQLAGSQRSSSDSLVTQYISWVTSSLVGEGGLAMLQRWMMLYGLTFAIAVIVIGLKKYRGDKKETRYVVANLVLIIAPILVEGTNLMWHFGSYNGYTLRMGFLIAFTLICIALHYGERIFKDIKMPRKYIIRQAVIAAVLCVAYAIFYNLMGQSNEIVAIVFFVCIMLTMFIVYFRKIKSEKEEFNAKSVIALIAVEVFVAAFSFVGPPKYYTYAPYQYGDYVELTNDVTDDLKIEESVTDRITNPDLSLNANYPLIMRRAALSSFTAALQSDTQSYADAFGYSKYFLWLLDSGGTVFTNSLLHITEAVNANELPEEFYTKVCYEGDYSLYEANYVFPFVTVLSGSLLSNDLDLSSNDKLDWIELHNLFYKAMSGDNEDLVSGMALAKTKMADNVYEYEVTADSNQAVYMSIKGEDTTSQNNLLRTVHVYVNDEAVIVPTLGDLDNTACPDDYNNNLIYLGTFSNEKVHVRIEYDNVELMKKSDVTIAELSMDKFTALYDSYKNNACKVTNDNNSLTIEVYGTVKNNYALIPIVSSDNWTVTLDGKEVNASEIAGLFTGVSIHSGKNVITLTFNPKGLKIGEMISLLILLIIIMCLIINHFKKIKVFAWIKYCAIFIYLQAFNAAVVAMFLIPTLLWLPALVGKIYYLVTTYLIK